MIYSACSKRRIGVPHHAGTPDRNAASRRNAAHRNAGRNIHAVVSISLQQTLAFKISTDPPGDGLH
jgi:hypothetical protein